MSIKQFAVNPFGVNAFVLGNSVGDAILIDPSVSNERERLAMMKYIESSGLTVRRVLNTHLHLDHVLGNAFVERVCGIKAEAHEEDSFLLDLQEEQSGLYGLPFDEAAPALGGFLADGDMVEVPGIKLQVIHVAGHSPGGLAFYCEDSLELFQNVSGILDADGKFPPVLFSGDTLFAGSMGRSDLFGGDESALISGIRNRLLTLPPDTIVFPGHGPSTTIASEKSWF